MIAQPQYLKMSVQAYFALDNESIDVRYEYIDGYAYLLAGGTPAHALIASNLIAEIRAHWEKVLVRSILLMPRCACLRHAMCFPMLP